MAQNNFGFFPNGGQGYQQGYPQGYNANNPNQRNNSQAQKQSKRSPAYEIAANVIVYVNKEGGTLKSNTWTPHDIKALSLFRETLVVERYDKQNKVVKFLTYAKSYDIPVGSSDFYTNMFDFLFSLDRGTSAKVKNIRDIKIFYGEDKGVSREVAFQLANSLKGIAEKEKIYPNVMLLPEGYYAQLPKILDEGRMSLIKSHIARYGAERVFLTQDRKTLSWKVSDKKPMNKEAEVDEKGNLPDEHTHTSFGLQNQHSLFKNIISDAAALQEYIRKHPNTGGMSIDICGEPLMMSRLWTDTSIYPGDTALRDYFSKHIYRPAAVWEFISGFEPIQIAEKLDLSDAHEAGTIYNIAYRACKEAKEDSYRNRLVTGSGASVLRQALRNLAKPFDSDKVDSTMLARLVDKFLANDRRARQDILDKEIGDAYREPFLGLLNDYTGYFTSLACLAYLFGYGFRYSNQLAEFMFEEGVQDLAGVKVFPDNILMFTLKAVVCQDTELPHQDADILTGIAVAKKHLKAVTGSHMTIPDLQSYAKVMEVLF